MKLYRTSYITYTPISPVEFLCYHYSVSDNPCMAVPLRFVVHNKHTTVLCDNIHSVDLIMEQLNEMGYFDSNRNGVVVLCYKGLYLFPIEENIIEDSTAICAMFKGSILDQSGHHNPVVRDLSDIINTLFDNQGVTL